MVVAPFLLLGLAVVLALVAQSQAVATGATNDADVIATRIATARSSKRGWTLAALVALVIGLVAAGWAIYETYGPGAEKDADISARLWLTPPGQRLVREACGRPRRSLRGQVADAATLSAASVPIDLSRRMCPSGAGTLVLPKRASAAAKY